MHIREVTDFDLYNSYVRGHAYGSLHQTTVWGDLQHATYHRSYFVLEAVDPQTHETVATALVITYRLPAGYTYFYVPRGPVFDPGDSRSVAGCDALLAALHTKARAAHAVYLRIDPPISQSETHRAFMHDNHFIRAHVQHQPEATLIIDIADTDEAVLHQMKPKGRYNIKVAERHGVTVTPSDNVDAFHQLLTTTTTRDGFHGHSLPYYREMLTILGTHAKLFLASYHGVPIAGALVTYFGNTATYYYGASANEHRNTMAPYLLHWRIMQDAKHQGFTHYDLFGIAPPDEPNHPWASVSEFKRKLGGSEVRYVGAWERVYRPLWYHAMTAAKRMRG